MKKLLLASLGVICVTLTGVNVKAALAVTVTNSAQTSGYTLDIRFDTAAAWSVTGLTGNGQNYGPGSFDSDGNLMRAANGGTISKIDPNNGTEVQARSGLASGTRGFAEIGGYQFAVDGDATVNRWSSADNIGSVSPTAVDVSGALATARAIGVGTVSGTDKLFLGEDGNALRRFSVNGDGSLTADWASNVDLGSTIRAMKYVQGRGLYVATWNTGSPSPATTGFLWFVDDSGNATQVTGGPFGVGAPLNQNYGLEYLNFNGNDYLITAGLSTGTSGFTVMQLDSNTSISAWDGYSTFSGSGFTGHADGNALFSQTVFANSTYLYTGAANTMTAWSISAVPEPHEYALMAIGALVLVMAVRRRKAQAVAVQA